MIVDYEIKKNTSRKKSQSLIAIQEQNDIILILEILKTMDQFDMEEQENDVQTISLLKSQINELETMNRKYKEISQRSKDKVTQLQLKLKKEQQNSQLLRRENQALKQQKDQYVRELNQAYKETKNGSATAQTPSSIPKNPENKDLSIKITSLQKTIAEKDALLGSLKKEIEGLVSNNHRSDEAVKKMLLQNNSVELVNLNSELEFKIGELQRQLEKEKANFEKKCSNLTKIINGMDRSVRLSQSQMQDMSVSFSKSFRLSRDMNTIVKQDEESMEQQSYLCSEEEVDCFKALNKYCDSMTPDKKINFLSKLKVFAGEHINNIMQGDQFDDD